MGFLNIDIEDFDPLHTKITDAETGELIHGVSSIDLHMEAGASPVLIMRVHPNRILVNKVEVEEKVESDK